VLHTRASALRRSSRNLFATIAGAAILAALAACGSDNSTSPHTLATITVTPANPTLTAGNTQQFTAVGKDADGNDVSITPTWSVEAGGGTIDNNGMFTAGSTAGTFTSTVKATSGGVSGTATVTVTAGSPSVVGDYTLQTVEGKAPPDTIVHTDSVTIVFLDGTMSLNDDMSYRLLFHTTVSTSGGTVADSSGTVGSYTADGTRVVTHKANSTDSTVVTVSSGNLTFTDGGLDFVFAKSP
jgi:hypothetical protein